MTGIYHQALGVRRWTGVPNHRGVLISELLQPAGYYTMMFGSMMMCGEWHLPGALHKRTFDRYFGFRSANPGSYFDRISTVLYLVDDQPYDFPAQGYYSTDVFTDYAEKFIADAAPREQPFFLYCAYQCPHWPLHAKEADIAKYRDYYRRRGWDQVRATRLERQRELGILDGSWEPAPRDARVGDWETAEHRNWQAERMAAYAAQVDCMDQNIGRIIAAIEKHGELDNTLILFLSDNGGTDLNSYTTNERLNASVKAKTWRADGTTMRAGNHPSIMPGPGDTFCSYGAEWAHVSNTPLRGYKAAQYEGGIATPLVVHWPAGLKQRGVRRDVGHVMDIMPTLLELADVEYPQSFPGRDLRPLEGRSLLPIFRGETRPDYPPLCWEFSGNRAVRNGEWKLVALKGQPWELYNLSNDRGEQHDLAKQHPERVAELAEIWQRWAEANDVLASK